MRICFISNPESTHTRRWVAWFARRGHQVCLICDHPLKTPWTDLQIYNLPAYINFPGVKYLPWIAMTRYIIEQWKPDILHAHRVTGAGWLGAFSGFHPLVVTPWGTDLYHYSSRTPWARWLARKVLTHADLVTADSQDLCQLAVTFGAPSERTHLVQWGVDLDLFSSDGFPFQMRQQLGIGEAPVVLSLRGIRPVYQQEVILEAMPKVLQAYPNAVLLLRDYNTEMAYKKRLQVTSQQLGIQQSVLWVEKLEPWERTIDVYRLADVGVSIPLHDGTPVSVLEAMACSVPVVVSDLPSLHEWITDGVNGLIVPVGDAEALSQAIIQLLQHPEQRLTFGLYNQGLLQSNANHQYEMEKMEGYYQAVLQARKQPA